NLDPLGSGGNCYAATIREWETGDEYAVNLDTIARGAARLCHSGIDNDLVNDFREANRTNGNRGDIDVENADMALQMGIFDDTLHGGPPAPTAHRREPDAPHHYRYPHSRGGDRHTMTTMTAEDQQATADPVDVDDLAATDDAPIVPELDPEAALLCALLHT